MTHKKIRILKTSEIPKFRRWLLKKQNGVCPICTNKITDPVLDHSHKRKVGGSGCCRAVVCRTCNVFLAKSENNAMRYRISHADLPRVLRAMADYFEKPHLPFLHPSEKEKSPKLTKQSYNKLKKVYDGKAAFPEYPTSKRIVGGKVVLKPKAITVKLQQLFDKYGIEPEFYK